MTDRLAYLDIARGFAALLVVLEHGLGQCMPGYLDWSLSHINLGQVGVLLFFTISGFIIPASLRAGQSQARFWLRRCCRLFPLYWTTIALTWLFTWLTGRPPCEVTLEQPGVWLANLTMLQGFLGAPHVLGVFWTLHVEVIIYLTCSALFALRLLDRPDRLLWLMLTYYLVEGAILWPVVRGKAFHAGRMFYYMAPLLGATLETWLAGRITTRSLVMLLTFLIFGPTAIFAANMSRLTLWKWLGNWSVAYGIFALLLMARHKLRAGFLALMGRISYSIYLLHTLVLALLITAHCPRWLLLPVLVVASIGLSALTYRWIEDPGIRLGRRLEKWWITSPRARTATAEPAPA
jgi:peptidoglycan/LPS O-acetylase OafA/YrhL